MNENIAQTELIERYLDNELSADEKARFESRLGSEAGLAEEVYLQRQLREGLRAAGRNRLLDMLATEDRQMDEYHPPAQVIRFDDATRQRFYWAAAAILLLLIPLYLVLVPGRRDDKLFAAYFKPYQGVSVRAGGPLEQAMEEYRQRDYAQALPILERLLGEGSAEDTTLFFKGNASLALEQTPDALSSFRQILTNPKHPFYREAQWYLALAYLQDGATDEAKTQLQSFVTDASHPHHGEATELLKKLK
jgi:tetratricopeptide (TPR) repeat protein